MATLQDVLNANVREGELYEKLDRGFVRCFACGHCCRIPKGQLGVCKVRFNEGGKLQVPWGYAAGVQCDPIEKKPFHHAYPGALAYSFGMLGCDLHCAYCQNWVTSQALRDPRAVSRPMHATPQRSRSRCLAPRRESSGQHLQRTADHQRVGRRGFQGSQGGRTRDRFRLERQRHAASARILAPVGGSLQSRPEELRRPPLPPTRRPHRTHSRRRFAACTKWDCGSRSSPC